jgi:hypothetical protein
MVKRQWLIFVIARYSAEGDSKSLTEILDETNLFCLIMGIVGEPRIQEALLSLRPRCEPLLAEEGSAQYPTVPVRPVVWNRLDERLVGDISAFDVFVFQGGLLLSSQVACKVARLGRFRGPLKNRN